MSLESDDLVSKLEQVAYSQQQNTLGGGSKKKYMCYVRVVINIMLNKLGDTVRREAFEYDAENNLKYYTGAMSGVAKLKLPIQARTVTLLFAQISIDPGLARVHRKCSGKKRVPDGNDGDHDGDAENVDADLNASSSSSDHVAAVPSVVDANAAEIRTCASQSYQNYKSGLKWFVPHDDVSWGKVAGVWLPECDEIFKGAKAAYKRVVGEKKRKGVMRFESGKCGYDINGYESLSIYFKSMKPSGKAYTYSEGMFCDLFTKLSVNSIGRSDNIDDVQLRYITWLGDSWGVKFGTTKADQEGESCDWKRMYCNIFSPHFCISLAMSVYIWCKPVTSDPVFLFDGKEQHKRYYSCMVKAVNDIDENIDMGCPRDNIGTHSNRKFAESTAVSTVDGPSRTQVLYNIVYMVKLSIANYIPFAMFL